ncbi:hypothetical protein J0H58_37400 [bacterium]|nr:hypothetical protein [bacterium]
MTRVAAFLAAVAAVACPAAGAPVPAGLEGPTHYYPMRVGDRMTYQFPHGEVEHVVTAVEKKGDARVVTVWGTDGGGRYAPVMAVEVSGKGLVLVKQAVVRNVPDGTDGQKPEDWLEDRAPVALLKLPPVAGQKWDAAVTPTLKASFVTGKEEVVKVPAGAFRAVPVDLHLDLPGGARPPFRLWFVRGVGPVKFESPGEEPAVLKAFSAAKD